MTHIPNVLKFWLEIWHLSQVIIDPMLLRRSTNSPTQIHVGKGEYILCLPNLKILSGDEAYHSLVIMEHWSNCCY